VLFVLTAIAVVGLPPLSGFIGKLLVMQATADDPWMPWIWATILITSLIGVVAFSRAGSTLFWKSHELDPEPDNDTDEGPRPRTGPIPHKLETDEHIQDVEDSASPALAFTSVGLLLAGLVALTVFAGPVTGYLAETAAQLHDLDSYLQPVLYLQEDVK
jgi:multicomponent K+:H+ antiporter subunit D